MSKTMKAVAKTEAAKGFEFVDAPIPKPRAGKCWLKLGWPSAVLTYTSTAGISGLRVA